MSLPPPEGNFSVGIEGVREPGLEHQESVKTIQNSLEEAGINHDPMPVTPETHIEVGDTYKIVTPEVKRVQKKEDPEVKGIKKGWGDFMANLNAWRFARPRVSESNKFNDKKMENVIKQTEAKAASEG